MLGRQFDAQMIHYLRKAFALGDTGLSDGILFGYFPPGAVVIPGACAVIVKTVFNGTSPAIDVGTAAVEGGASADPDNLYAGASDVTEGTVGSYPGATATIYHATTGGGFVIMNAATGVGATVTLTVTGSPTTGAGVVVLGFVPNNDG